MIVKLFEFYENLQYNVLQEARVRFAGFGYVEDEWVNVKRGIRKRSNPLEPSECHKVKAGDLVLCYRVYAFISLCPSVII